MNQSGFFFMERNRGYNLSMQQFPRLKILLSNFIIISLLLLIISQVKNPYLTPSPQMSWKYADLKIIDPVDAPDPALDIIAAYIRQTEGNFQIRVDFLKLETAFVNDIYLGFNIQPIPPGLMAENENQLTSDLWIEFPAASSPLIAAKITRWNTIQPRIIRNIKQNYVLIELPGNSKDLSIASVDIFTASPGDNHFSDSVENISLSGFPPAPAPILLEFWNTLPAYTPAQTLRRWDGAHTGPFGQRHGLSILLNAAKSSQIPMTLLDLKTPASLMGLDALGALKTIRQLEKERLILLPEVNSAFADYAHQETIFNQQVRKDYQLSRSLFNFSKSFQSVKDFSSAFGYAILLDPAHLLADGNTTWIPLPMGIATPQSTGQDPVNSNGFSNTVIEQIISTALSPDPSDIVVFGGNLPTSPWGDLSIAPQLFEYISQHPWIAPLNESQLIGFPKMPLNNIQGFSCEDPLCLSDNLMSAPSEMESKIADQINQLQSEQIQSLAWDQFFRLIQLEENQDLTTLRRNYLGEIGVWEEVDRWLMSPTHTMDCERDVNSDQQPECILTSQQIILILNPTKATIIFAGAQQNGVFTQWIGNSSQFAVGLSDPSFWNLNNGLRSDPSVISSGFRLNGQMIQTPFEISNLENQGVVLKNVDQNLLIKYQIEDTYFQFKISSDKLIEAQISLVIKPDIRYKPGWINQTLLTEHLTDNSWSWGPINAQTPKISFQADFFQFSTALDSSKSMKNSEDPNFDYPAGHYLPYPTGLLKIFISDKNIIQFSID